MYHSSIRSKNHNKKTTQQVIFSDCKFIPYKSISHFSVETSGHFDLEAKFLVENLQFRKDNNIVAIQQALTSAVLS